MRRCVMKTDPRYLLVNLYLIYIYIYINIYVIDMDVMII